MEQIDASPVHIGTSWALNFCNSFQCKSSHFGDMCKKKVCKLTPSLHNLVHFFACLKRQFGVLFFLNMEGFHCMILANH